MDVYRVFFIFFMYFPIHHCGNDGVCYRIERTITTSHIIYFKKTFCCDNYEIKEDKTCKVCRIGFTSRAGMRCTICKGERYGWRCAKKCECYQNERCDRIHGCVSTFNSTVSTYGSNNVHYITEITLNEIRGIAKDFTTMEIKEITIEGTTQHGINEDNLSQDGKNRQVFHFSIGVGSVLVIIVFAIITLIVCLKRRKKRKQVLKTSESGIPLTQPLGGPEENNLDEEHGFFHI